MNTSIIRIDLDEVQTDKGYKNSCKTDVEHCFICGKALTSDYSWVEMGTDGFLYLQGTPDQSQGWFAIGLNCLKKITKKATTQQSKP